MHRIRCAALAGMGVIGLGASLATADTVEVRRTGEGLGRNITLGGSVVPVPLTFHMGELTHEFRNGTGIASGLTGTIQTFCTDLNQDSSYDWQVYTVVALAQSPDPGPPMGPVKAQAIADITAGANGAQHASDDYAAAFQMMIWEIIGDYNGTPASIDLASGAVQFSSPDSYFTNVSTIFNTTLRSFIGLNASQATLRAASNPNFQEQLVQVPSPSTGALAGLGMLLAGGRRRRR